MSDNTSSPCSPDEFDDLTAIKQPIEQSDLNTDNIPQEFKQHNNWLLWKREPVIDSKTGKQKVDGTGELKWTKVPYQANGFKAASTKSNTWANFESIKSAYDSGRFSGIGFAIGDSGLTCIDIDHEDQWKPSELGAIYKGLNNKYYKETSPSGSGYHLWVKAIKPNNMGCKSKNFHNSLIEVYNSDRFITMTGNSPVGTIQECQKEFEQVFKPLMKQAENIIPLPISTVINHDNETVLSIINDSKQSAKFGDLHYGGGNPSADTSGEDMTYMNILAFYTRGNAQQMDSIYRQSALVRPKWDSKRNGSTYGQMTIDKAVAECKEFYSQNTLDDFDNIKDDLTPEQITAVIKSIPKVVCKDNESILKIACGLKAQLLSQGKTLEKLNDRSSWGYKTLNLFSKNSLRSYNEDNLFDDWCSLDVNEGYTFQELVNLSDGLEKEWLDNEISVHQDDDLISICPDSTIGKFAAELAKAAKMPRNTTFLTVLSIFSSVACRTMKVEYQHGNYQPVGINFCGEQPPGASKSRTLQTTQSPVFSLIKEAKKQVFKDIADLKEKIDEAKECNDKENILNYKKEMQQLTVKHDQIFEFITDTTPEALDATLQVSNGYYSIASAEQGAINSLLGLSYSDSKSVANRDLALKGYNGEWHNSKRKGRETYGGHVVGTITALAQTGMIKNLLMASDNAGVIERFFVWSEPDLLGTRDHTENHIMDDMIKAKFSLVFQRMYHESVNTDYDDLHSLRLSSRAWHKLALAKNEYEPTIASGGSNSANLLRGVIAKYDLFVMKTAANLHLAQSIEHLIHDDRVYEAMKIVDVYIKHLKSLIEESAVNALSDREVEVIEFIGQKKMTGRQIADVLYKRKHFKKGGKTSRTAVKDTIDKLVADDKLLVDDKLSFRKNIYSIE